ncbi:MAG: glycosyltransferase [Lachnospiraceae bacterium]|nr:glycosyltransferase [Lachnospiraceae bacterium]
MQTRVSVVIPFFNVADYLPECVDSVLAQSLPGVETILVDDGSDDGSEKLADEYAKKHPDRVKVIHQKNMGAAVARNAGFDIAEGEYIHGFGSRI